MKLKTNLLCFDLCQKIITAYNQQPTSINQRQIHQFITNYDKNTLRMKSNFQPLQPIIKSLTPRLIQDTLITQNIKTLCNVTSIYNFLNLYDKAWMEFSLGKIIRYIKSNKTIDVQSLYKVYRCAVELNCDQNEKQIKIIRNELNFKLKKILLKSQSSHWFYFNLQQIHGMIKFLILDPKKDKNAIESTLKDIQKIYDSLGYHIHQDNLTFPYSHSASIYQLCRVFNLQLPQGNYLDFIKKCFHNNLKAKNPQSSKSQQFKLKGQSVFQLRFQKHLVQNGYWFDRNIKIGIHEYDILIKGTQRSQYYPFQSLNIQNFNYQSFKPINNSQLKLFQNNQHIWYREQLKLYDNKILINLNGPYHFLYGDKAGLTRSQSIKQDVALYYGYSNFKVVDYKLWQKQTPNKLKVKEYLDKMMTGS